MFEILTTPLNKVRSPTTHKPVRKMRVAVFCSFGPFCLVVDPERRLVLGIKPVAVADGVANVVLELLHRLLFFAGIGAQFDGTHRHAFVKGRA